jgi:predicted TIM-barrel fold metal-dependent hydrolase
MLEAENVERAVVSGLPGQGDNDFIVQVCERSLGRLWAIPGFCPVTESEKILVSYAEKKLKGIKIHPRLSRLNLNDPRFHLALEVCADLGLVVFLCTNMRPPSPAENTPFVSHLHSLLEKHSHIKMVLVHGGYDDVLRVSEVIRPFENVFLDLSSTVTRFYDSSIGTDIRFLLRTFQRRLVFGSDFPEFSYRDVLQALSVLGFEKSDLLKKGVLGEHFFEFLENC